MKPPIVDINHNHLRFPRSVREVTGYHLPLRKNLHFKTAKPGDLGDRLVFWVCVAIIIGLFLL